MSKSLPALPLSGNPGRQTRRKGSEYKVVFRQAKKRDSRTHEREKQKLHFPTGLLCFVCVVDFLLPPPVPWLHYQQFPILSSERF